MYDKRYVVYFFWNEHCNKIKSIDNVIISVWIYSSISAPLKEFLRPSILAQDVLTSILSSHVGLKSR